MNNTITFSGNRNSVSSTGNVERFEFKITSERKLHSDTVKELVNEHGCGGQDCSWEYEVQDGLHSYIGTSTRYSD